jgi:outer membrane murein-binding lipoprotein Lpp
MKMIRLAAALVATVALAGCAGTLAKFQQFNADYRTAVAEINASIAATAPVVANYCADAQKWAMLLAPFVARAKGDAPAVFDATNAALGAYCQNIPQDIPSTAAAIAAAAADAKDAYNRAKGR